jgi:DNA-binding response OmpR family regulator
MRKVLLIDGDHEFLGMASSFLKAANILVDTADTAGLARSKIEEFKPDLIILNRDLLNDTGRLIPDGLEMLREIKSRKPWGKIPLILLVNDASENDLEKLRLLKYKADDYASKPIADNELLRRVENLIGFDPDETTCVLLDEKDSLSLEQALQSSTDNPEFESAAQKEIQELLKRLGDELIQTKTEAETPEAKPAPSPEQLRSEFELLQEKLREQEKRFQKIREKSRKAVAVLEKRIADLESENRNLSARLFNAEASLQELIEDKHYLLDLLKRTRELVAGLDGLKKSLDKNFEKARQLIRELDQFSAKAGLEESAKPVKID